MGEGGAKTSRPSASVDDDRTQVPSRDGDRSQWSSDEADRTQCEFVAAAGSAPSAARSAEPGPGPHRSFQCTAAAKAAPRLNDTTAATRVHAMHLFVPIMAHALCYGNNLTRAALRLKHTLGRLPG